MNILIAGGFGFVGRNLYHAFTQRGHGALRVPKHNLNIGDEQSVRRAIQFFKPDILLNAAGSKDLQWCEDHPVEALHINGHAPGMLARVCDELKVKFVHISSDHAYAEPMTSYGDSKRIGDDWILGMNTNAMVVVTGHVYAKDCPWVLWLDGELRAGRRVQAWSDIWNWPTYAPNLADMILDMIDRNFSGKLFCVGGWKVNRLMLFRCYAAAVRVDPLLVMPFDGPCPSKLHPRKITVGDGYCGYRIRWGIVDGFEDMVKGVL